MRSICCSISVLSAAIILVLQSTLATALSSTTAVAPKNVVVFGGTGYVGANVCERLVKRGHSVTALSRRGVNPRPNDENMRRVTWVSGDATDPRVVKKLVNANDAAVHAIGLLFDIDSGLSQFNTIVSGSGSLPGERSTYDEITRRTAFNVADAIASKPSLFSKSRYPLAFVSCAEAGWPDVPLGQAVEDNLAPTWLKGYLAAKRAVETRLGSQSKRIRACLMRPSLIWDWTKFDVLPVIPVFNLASTVGVPFVDKTVRVETLADAIVQCVEDDDVEGVQRYMQMEKLAKRA
uniref:NAD-dependent epimerase/dehydratase domain-containing protein n=1 Tax=Corethron hystrix TaxID=216773 RepID=A0A7S1BZT6_9STRA|mmetsp:Transcript_6848/g.14778  ORF Transcript_6848/g.14778 Transcript_6848/m.14778 type:complete len:292 (+) Transcript_6848:61-936(+)